MIKWITQLVEIAEVEVNGITTLEVYRKDDFTYLGDIQVGSRYEELISKLNDGQCPIDSAWENEDGDYYSMHFIWDSRKDTHEINPYIEMTKERLLQREASLLRGSNANYFDYMYKNSRRIPPVERFVDSYRRYCDITRNPKTMLEYFISNMKSFGIISDKKTEKHANWSEEYGAYINYGLNTWLPYYQRFR